MSENSKIDPHDLTMQQREALCECERWKRGTYAYKPRTMRKLAEMGLAESVGNGTHALTAAGISVVQILKGKSR
ncbi:hypothetical protein [Burkholderia sp. BCC1988]|uniref:hypothetical protein n=1 Tax=Burkholderia sp. BCC1988 TaxID=2817443 RepID=UPI002AAFB755|nr:hypothetical protein [Burkholderia sp. BCC1988]